jgi:uncharacterized protein YhaN
MIVMLEPYPRGSKKQTEKHIFGCFVCVSYIWTQALSLVKFHLLTFRGFWALIFSVEYELRLDKETAEKLKQEPMPRFSSLDFRKVSDETLGEFIANNSNKIHIVAAIEERKRRDSARVAEAERAHHQSAIESIEKLHLAMQKLQKPHWTMTPNFWIALFAMIFAAIAALPVIREWIPVSQPANKAAGLQWQSTNSVQAKPAAQQKAPAATNTALATNLLQK